MSFTALSSLALLLAAGPQETADPTPRGHGQLPLSVLYLGDVDKDRAQAFVEFLSRHFTYAEAIHRDLFAFEDAEDFDVVLLDWSQSEVDLMAMDKIESPLGAREEWTKPLVLLDSAGLLMAGPWELQGSWG